MLRRRWEWRGSRRKGTAMDRMKSSEFCCFAYRKKLDENHMMNENGHKTTTEISPLEGPPNEGSPNEASLFSLRCHLHIILTLSLSPLISPLFTTSRLTAASLRPLYGPQESPQPLLYPHHQCSENLCPLSLEDATSPRLYTAPIAFHLTIFSPLQSLAYILPF